MSVPAVSIAKGVVGGEPCIDGTRIPVASIVALAQDRLLTPADIVELYPQITEGEVEWALHFHETYTRRRKRRKPADERSATEGGQE